MHCHRVASCTVGRGLLAGLGRPARQNVTIHPPHFARFVPLYPAPEALCDISRNRCHHGTRKRACEPRANGYREAAYIQSKGGTQANNASGREGIEGECRELPHPCPCKVSNLLPGSSYRDIEGCDIWLGSNGCGLCYSFTRMPED